MGSPTFIPISKTNIPLYIAPEAVWGTADGTPNTKQLQYAIAALVRQQALDPNVDLTGNRKQYPYVPGAKNPGGQIKQHQSDRTAVMWLHAMLGARTTTELGACNILLTVTQSATVGSTPPEAGAHSYAVIISKGGSGTTKKTLHSGLNVVLATITADGTHKVHIARSGGSLPTGWTWALYRTAAAADPAVIGNYKVVTGATALAATVLTFDDDTADATLGAAMPTSSDTGYGDYKSVMSVGTTLPSYTLERQHPYQNGDTDYVIAKGAVCDTANLMMKATGFDDFDGTFLASLVDTEAATVIAGSSPTDWRAGETLHDAMIGAGKVMLGPNGGSITNFVGYLVDLKYAHNNNLDKTDFPMGMLGNRGSAIPMQSVGTLSATIKVSDKTILPILQDPSVLYSLSVEFDFATFGHSKLMEFLAVQWDPIDAAVSGQGILTVAAAGHVVVDPTSGETVRGTVINGEPTASYDHS